MNRDTSTGGFSEAWCRIVAMRGPVSNLKRTDKVPPGSPEAVLSFRRSRGPAVPAELAGGIVLGPGPRTNSLWKRIYAYRYVYLILFPGIAFFVIFAYVPMYGIQLAFKEYNIAKGFFGSPWVGLAKFKLLVEYPEFWTAFRNTIIIALLKILFGFPAPILIAILLNELRGRRTKRFLQTVYTFPHFLSWVVVAGIAFRLLYNDGAINNFLDVIGRPRVPFLQDPHVFRGLVVFSDIWKEAGWSCIMYLAAIAGIDPGLYESAVMDGANRWQRIRHITWPGIAGMAAILLILSIGNMMNAGFDQIFNLYNPLVYEVADIIDTYVYRIGLLEARYDFATAVGFFKNIVGIALIFSSNAIIKRFNEYGIW